MRTTSTKLQKLCVNCLNAFTFLTTVVLIGAFIELLGIAYTYLFYHIVGPGGGQFPYWLFTAMVLIWALRMGFFFAVILYIAKPLKNVLYMLYDKIHPPYHSFASEKTSVIVSRAQRNQSQRLTLNRAFIPMLIGVFYVVFAVRYWHFQPPHIVIELVDLIRNWEFTSIFVTVSQGVSIPLNPLGDYFVNDRDSLSLASSLLVLWIPTAIITISLLNIVYIVHSWTKRGWFHVMKYYLFR